MTIPQDRPTATATAEAPVLTSEDIEMLSRMSDSEREVYLEQRLSGPMPDEVSAEHAVWNSRKILRQIRQVAEEQLVSPYALLGGVLANAAVSISPRVVLPAIIGGVGSLNVCLAVVGGPSAGKTAGFTVADEHFEIVDANHHRQYPRSIDVTTGEGIVDMLQREEIEVDGGTDIDGKPITQTAREGEYTRLRLHVDEIGTLAAEMGRPGSTTAARLCSVWSGSSLSTGNAGKTRRRFVAAHEYRACLSVGVQPELAGGLLDREAQGLPQRFLWLDSRLQPQLCNYQAEDHCDDLVDPNPYRVTLPPQVPAANTVGGHVVLPVLKDIRTEIRQARITGTGNGHEMQVRLKIAALLSLIDGRWGVEKADWDDAEFLIQHSRDLRAYCAEEIMRGIERKAQQTAAAQAAAKTAMLEIQMEEAKSALLLKLDERLRDPEWSAQGEVAAAVVRKKLNANHRQIFYDALEQLEDVGHVFARPVTASNGQSGLKLSLTASGHLRVKELLTSRPTPHLKIVA